MNKFGIGSLVHYELVDQVGEGAYGYVYKGRDKRTNEFVALKRLILHRESAGFPLSSVREIKFLKSLQHKNVVQLKDVVTSKGCEHLELPIKAEFSKSQETLKKGKSFSEKEVEEGCDVLQLCGNLYFVFEFVEHDLGGLIDSRYRFSPREIKCIMKQLFEVLEFMQERRIVHRDIKSSNILISNHHHVKLADFGLARSVQGHDGRELRVDLSNNVITLWYRPPELLLGAVRYSTAVDIWSTGCVLAELELGRPIFPGKTEVEQLDMIFRAFGTPTEETWPDVMQLPHAAMTLPSLPKYPNIWESSYADRLSEDSLQVLSRIMVLDPVRRSTAKLVLGHKYFHNAPLPPDDPTELPPLVLTEGVHFHEYKTKLQRRKHDEEQQQQQQRRSSAAGSVASDLDSETMSSRHSDDKPAAAPVAAKPPAPPAPPSAPPRPLVAPMLPPAPPAPPAHMMMMHSAPSRGPPPPPPSAPALPAPRSYPHTHPPPPPPQLSLPPPAHMHSQSASSNASSHASSHASSAYGGPQIAPSLPNFPSSSHSQQYQHPPPQYPPDAYRRPDYQEEFYDHHNQHHHYQQQYNDDRRSYKRGRSNSRDRGRKESDDRRDYGDRQWRRA